MQRYISTREKKQQFLYLVGQGVDVREARLKVGVDRQQAHRWLQKKPEVTGKNKDNIVLAIPDLHSPHIHSDALDFLLYVQKRFQPNTIVFLGDEVDFHAFSKYPKNPDGFSPGHELKIAIEKLIPFYVAFPEALICVSNHTIRPRRMMKELGIPEAMLPTYSTMLNAPDGWVWKDKHEIDGVIYMHGDLARGGKNGWTSNSEVFHKSCVVGHWHSRAGVVYDSKMFNLNAGCLIDETAYAFEYAKGSEKRPNLGCGLVVNGEAAFFLPMRLNELGRWIGRL